MSRVRPSVGFLFVAGFLGGVLAGFSLWSREIARSQRELFSRSQLRRVAALSYLGTRPSVETARLLGDYVNWEPSPLLRRRGKLLLRRMERELL